MKKIFLLIFIFLVIGLSECISQTDDNGAPYFPLRVGNAFYYRYYHCSPGSCDSAFVISRITQTKTFKGNRYYYCSNIFGRINQNYYIRYNSTKGYLVYLDTSNVNCNYEIALYNLSASTGDSVSSFCTGSYNYRCSSIVDSIIFNLTSRVKKFGYYHTSNGWVTQNGTYFARRLGSIYDYSSTYNNSFSSFQRFLLGCKINNVVYGDTIDHITPAYADSGRYMPLAVGNKWVYYCISIPPVTYYKSTAIITKDTIINNKKYFYITNFPSDMNPFWIRFDPTSGKLMRYVSSAACNNEYSLFRFADRQGDSVININCCFYNYKCLGIKDTSIFGLTSKEKNYYYSYSAHYATSDDYRFIKNIGFSYFESDYAGNVYNSIRKILTGCVLNGIVYGDTASAIPPSYADSSRYFPLKIGNKYYYKCNYTYHRSNPDSTAYDSSYYIVNITDTSRFHGKLYYKMNSFINGTYNYFRHDLDSGYLVAYDSSNWCTVTPYELKCFMLRSNANQDGSGTCWINNFFSRCFEIHDTSAFGSMRKVKGFYTMWGGTSGGHFTTLLLKDIGLCQYEKYYYNLGPGTYTTQKYRLTGAFVDGVKYGDTNIIGIKAIGSIIPEKYELYQNYPNPFNPTTSIRYSVPSVQNIKLIVYDIPGKEIATLVNGKQSPGVYEVTWDASQFPSGVYFYKFTAGDFSEVKKMVLIK